MVRPIWNGIITFGLVSIPIKLYPATENRDIRFHQLHNKCKTRIKELHWCPTCERAVEWEEIEKGFEYAKGQYVVVTPEDLEELPLPNKDIIAIQEFVKLAEIDPIYFEKSYYLEPDEKSFRPYTLFLKVLNEKGMVGVGSIALRNKERLCCLRPSVGCLLLNTLLYPDEIRITPPLHTPKAKLVANEVTMASTLVDMMARSFKPEHFKDHYREALQEIIDAQLKGKEVAHPAARPKKVYDLMEALKASVAGAKTGSRKAASIQKQKKRRKVS